MTLTRRNSLNRNRTFYMIFLAVIVALSAGGIGAFRTQSAAIRGRLFCGDKPATNTLVQLYDEDDGPDPDDLLDKAYTDENGSFELKGDTMELTNIDPELRIYHDCDMHLPLCKREWVIGIPDKYITAGKNPTKVMELGNINLEMELENEDRHDCFH